MLDENLLVPPADLLEATDREVPEAGKPERTSRHTLCAMRFDLQWRSEQARHTDSQVSQKLNLWRDIFPPALEAGVLDKPVGHRATHTFARGALIEAYRANDSFGIKPRRTEALSCKKKSALLKYFFDCHRICRSVRRCCDSIRLDITGTRSIETLLLEHPCLMIGN